MTALVLAAAARSPRSRPVTEWPERLAWTGLLLGAVVGIWWLMLRGWRRRAARQADVPPLCPRPADLGAQLLGPVEGIYVTSTTAGDWLDRIVVRDLGVRSQATARVTPAGVSFDRVGATDVFVPAAWLRGVRREKGMAGKYVEEGGLVVLTWELGERLLDTGFRARRAAEADALVAAVEGLVTPGSVS